MILNYTLPGAEENILSGIKIHTIRTDRQNRWKEGYIIHQATGSRTSNYNCFTISKVISVQQLLLVNVDGDTKATIDRRRLSEKEVLQLAINDGFPDLTGLREWFFRNGDLYAGKIIQWTNFKY